jgi:hypothetical protein
MARDTFYPQVKQSLIKDGWQIVSDPLRIEVGGVKLEVDLGAERSIESVLAAERDREKIAIEVKSFISNSPIHEFHSALGQFIVYRSALAEIDPDRKLYLAVPLATYSDFLQLTFPKKLIQENQLSLMIYNPIIQEIVKWL